MSSNVAATSEGTQNPNEYRCRMVDYTPFAWCSLSSAMGAGGFVWWLSGCLVCWFAQFCPVAPFVVLLGGSMVFSLVDLMRLAGGWLFVLSVAAAGSCRCWSGGPNCCGIAVRPFAGGCMPFLLDLLATL